MININCFWWLSCSCCSCKSLSYIKFYSNHKQNPTFWHRICIRRLSGSFPVFRRYERYCIICGSGPIVIWPVGQFLSKTKCIFICGNKKNLVKPAPLTLCGRDLPWVRSATHLGHELHESGMMEPYLTGTLWRLERALALQVQSKFWQLSRVTVAASMGVCSGIMVEQGPRRFSIPGWQQLSLCGMFQGRQEHILYRTF